MNSETEAACKLCGARAHDTLYSLTEFSVRECHACGLVWLQIASGAPAVETLYDDRYFKEREEYFYEQDEAQHSSLPGVIRNFEHGLELLRCQREPGRLLDVGCATGVFLSLAQRAGWQVTGLDISDYAAEYCHSRGFDAYAGRLDEVDLPEQGFDVVTLWDVVEHFTDPLHELQSIRRLLTPGGLLLVDTPNQQALVRSLARMLYRLSGGRLDYPVRKLYHCFHLFYFDQRTLGDLLRRAGFSPLVLEGRAIPFGKGRANLLERVAIDTVAAVEHMLDRQFELVAVARKD